MTQLADIQIARQARQWLESDHLFDAQRLALKLIQRNPKNGDALWMLAEIAWRMQQHNEAVEYIRKLIRHYPNDTFGYVKLNDFYIKLGRTKDIIPVLKGFLKKHPDDPRIVLELARVYEINEDVDDAIALIKPFFDSRTDTVEMAHLYASILAADKKFEDALQVLLRHTGNPAVSEKTLQGMYYLLGRIYEGLKKYDQAFQAFTAANAMYPDIVPEETLIARQSDLLSAFSAEAIKRLPRAKNDSRLPILILCRPRSGSTLVERIIAAHPKVHAAGERDLGMIRTLNMRISSSLPYPQCLRDLDQNDVDSLNRDYLAELQALAPMAERITNKHLHLFEHIGFLSLIVPNAVVIDLRRDPIDNCLACFTAELGTTLPYCDLRLLGVQHRLYEQLMDHWYKVLDVNMLRVNYEDLVDDPETWSRKIIAHCGLEWDDRCLRFHEKEAVHSSTAAPTLSLRQVRQPIYKSSVARAKRFEKFLGPLYEGLGLPIPDSVKEAQAKAASDGDAKTTSAAPSVSA